MDIMQQVGTLTDGRVRIGPGTLYHLLEQFADAEMIRETKCEGRRRSYVLTDVGEQALRNEYDRLQRQTEDYKRLMGGVGNAAKQTETHAAAAV